MTLIWFPNGHITRKCHSIQTLKNPHEVLFSRKDSNITHAIIHFNNLQVQRANQQRHLGIILDEKLNFKSHIDKGLTKASKGIAIIKRLQSSLPCKSLITIYKAIIRPTGIPKYLTDLIPKREIGDNIRNRNSHFFIAEMKVLKIHFSHILLRLGMALIHQL